MAAHRKTKNTTLDDLAVMVSRGFTELRTELKEDIGEVKKDVAGVKEDLAGVKKDLTVMKEDLEDVKKDVAGVKEVVKIVAEEMDALHKDVRYIKNTTDMLVRGDIARDTKFEELDTRVERLERKAGIVAK